ncbi:hypothetical protein [Nocardia seriolae]|uniref:hypothetical protein n=1 Tax=Nocardia seriolae TaxID=37332 RepID=UPI0011603A4D|nr:hypothetical protein [Nocardia seriolae]MTJ61254.1 hypothetical protein [Nocardia seriolae]MTJ70011.1 hypothetical protein [Nocardia seriolae]MTJ90621.1 hypothetical protein [Nocardia seriolae]MTK34582.1 hypothetical protein [Nocardia seriolae]MTK39231.1 hypothetical protein [Nocardia seriolae]
MSNRMRRTLLVTSVLAAACALAPVAAAEPAGPALTIQAVYGPEQFPMAGIAADIALCGGGANLATVTTGIDGSAVYNGAPGCYRVQIATPIGCALDGDAAVQITSVPGGTPPATFRFRCA